MPLKWYTLFFVKLHRCAYFTIANAMEVDF